MTGVKRLPALDSELWDSPTANKGATDMKRKSVRLAVASLVAVLSVFGLSQAPASAGMAARTGELVLLTTS